MKGITNRSKKLSTAAKQAVRAFLLSYFSLCIAGFLLLLLPGVLLQGSLSWDQAFFTSISAVTLTGMDIADIGNTFSARGFIVLLFLIQAGAFLIVSFSISFLRLLKFRSLYGGEAETDTDQGFKAIYTKSAANAGLYLFVLEALSIYALYLFWPGGKAFPRPVQPFHAIFDGISIACQAGYSSIPSAYSHVIIAHYYMLLLVMGGVSFVASLGYPVIYDLIAIKRLRFRMQYPDTNWLLQTRVILFGSGIITFIGIVLFFLFERSSGHISSKAVEAAFTSIFNACGIRAGGISNFGLEQLQAPTLIMFMLLMFIGTGSVSTGGGVGVGTMFLLFSKPKNPIQVAARKAAFNVLLFSISFILLGWLIQLPAAATPTLSLLCDQISAFCNTAFTHTGFSSMGSLHHFFFLISMLAGRLGIPLIAFITMYRLLGTDDTREKQTVLIP